MVKVVVGGGGEGEVRSGVVGRGWIPSCGSKKLVISLSVLELLNKLAEAMGMVIYLFLLYR